MALGANAGLPEKRRAFYATLEGADDLSRLVETAEKMAAKPRDNEVLDFLYRHTRVPLSSPEEWKAEVRCATSIEILLRDLFNEYAPSMFGPVFEPVASTQAAEWLQSRGALFLTLHSGFARLLRLFFQLFLPSGLMIQNFKFSQRSLDASNPAAALFGAMRALEDGRPVYIAPDGPFGTPAGAIEVLGASCAVTGGAAFLAYETRCETAWCALRRDGRAFIPVIERGPKREDGESFPEFRDRLMGFYASMIESVFTGDPRSLALSGTWRNLFLKVILELDGAAQSV